MAMPCWLDQWSKKHLPLETVRYSKHGVLLQLPFMPAAAPVLPPLIGSSPIMEQLQQRIQRLAVCDTTTLIIGPSGSGKELVARHIHAQSGRSAGPFVGLKLRGTLGEQLFEATLFGHAKGAFTGADQARIGLVASAEGGCLFLDEVGEIPLQLQAKLLRLLQEREYLPVGETKTKRCDIRIIAATNRPLQDEVQQGRFRADLFYRLEVLCLSTPSLNQRRADLPQLAQHIMLRASQELGLEMKALSKQAQQELMQYDWPGNVRELNNALIRALALADGKRIDSLGVIALSDVTPPATPSEIASLAEVEAHHIGRVLQHCRGNRRSCTDFRH